MTIRDGLADGAIGWSVALTLTILHFWPHTGEVAILIGVFCYYTLRNYLERHPKVDGQSQRADDDTAP
ncbi:hypothetical protein Cmtc_18620 [Cupriavidus sp. TKC]|uniref:hypothetical protein n=1 Tax=Cupriavidus sp. TKC TaxID=2880159 RepID=UPI0025A918A0|nr:hypothetical protein [Cupriavidus sp. TKC]GMG90642.1 hypothetical protein Cmtc_18620 [Cupriavidus sp. TKC]